MSTILRSLHPWLQAELENRLISSKKPPFDKDLIHYISTNSAADKVGEDIPGPHGIVHRALECFNRPRLLELVNKSFKDYHHQDVLNLTTTLNSLTHGQLSDQQVGGLIVAWGKIFHHLSVMPEMHIISVSTPQGLVKFINGGVIGEKHSINKIDGKAVVNVDRLTKDNIEFQFFDTKPKVSAAASIRRMALQHILMNDPFIAQRWLLRWWGQMAAMSIGDIIQVANFDKEPNVITIECSLENIEMQVKINLISEK